MLVVLVARCDGVVWYERWLCCLRCVCAWSRKEEGLGGRWKIFITGGEGSSSHNSRKRLLWVANMV